MKVPKDDGKGMEQEDRKTKEKEETRRSRRTRVGLERDVVERDDVVMPSPFGAAASLLSQQSHRTDTRRS